MIIFNFTNFVDYKNFYTNFSKFFSENYNKYWAKTISIS